MHAAAGDKTENRDIAGQRHLQTCNRVFNLLKNESACPDCGSKDWNLLCGKEFMIKEIIAC